MPLSHSVPDRESTQLKELPSIKNAFAKTAAPDVEVTSKPVQPSHTQKLNI
jgi:hypothetical protein